MSHAPECSGKVYGCPRCPERGLMTIGESFDHSREAHPWTLTKRTFSPAHYVPVVISVEAYNLPQFKDVAEKHAKAFGRTPVLDGQPKRPRKRGTITLMTQPHEETVVQAIVAELEALTA
jgi:hypothetical protein